MGLQRYRADVATPTQPNGATVWYRWMGGPTLALIRNCPVVNSTCITPRTVYVTGEADTWFSVPAACTYKRKVVRGYITSDDSGQYVFRIHSNEPGYMGVR